jgi:rod shape-determining protein MreD
MTPRSRRSLRDEVWTLAPAALTFVLMVVGFLPLQLPYFAAPAPMFSVIAVFYWSTYRPDLMPAPLAFALGLVHDVLSGGPIGLMALVLTLVHAFCINQRRILVGKSFVLGWVGFAFVAGGAAAVAWAATVALHMRLVDPSPALVQLIASMAIYPVLAWLFGRTEQLMPRPA